MSRNLKHDVKENISELKIFSRKLKEKQNEFERLGHLISAGFYKNAYEAVESIIKTCS